MNRSMPFHQKPIIGNASAWLGLAFVTAAILSPSFADGKGVDPVSDTLSTPLPFPIPGALIARDGRYFSPATRAYPPPRPPLAPEGRWSLPSEIAAKLPGGHYLELRGVDVGNGNSFVYPLVPATMALPCWRIPLQITISSNRRESIEIDYLAGPRGTVQAEIRWDGQVAKSVNTLSDSWQFRRVALDLSVTDLRPGLHLLEIVDAGPTPFDRKQLPPALFVTGMKLSTGIKVMPQSIQVSDIEKGPPFLLPAMGKGMPVRLWTLGYGNRSNMEFVHSSERPVFISPGPSKTLADGYDASLVSLEFPIERNPDGSQVADFQRAASRVASISDARLNNALSLSIRFRSPVKGSASLVGDVKATGKWRLEVNGSPLVECPAQEMGALRIDGIPVQAGENSVRIVAEEGITSWDWIGLDLQDDSFLERGLPLGGFPLSPPAPLSIGNPAVAIDPQWGRRVSGESQIHPELFGITDHNGLLELMRSPALLDSVKAMNLGAIKGADGIVETTAPRNPILKSADLDAYYESTQPLSQFKNWYWNDRSLKVIDETRALHATRVVIGSGLPSWALLSQTDGWNVPPRDLDVAAHLVSGALQTVRPLWPELRYLYAWNEPDSAWWKARDRLANFPGGYTGYFRAYLARLSHAVKAVYPEMQIGAPTTANLPIGSTALERLVDEWSDWWEPLLRDSWNDLDFLDFHFYGNDPREVLANLNVLAAAGQVLHGGRKPVAITESNYAEPVFVPIDSIQAEPDCWRYRSLPYARYLITMAGQPDRLWANMAHDLMANEYGFYLYGGLEPTSIVDVFQALAPLRGTLLGTSCLDSQFAWTAVRNGNRVVIAIVSGERNGGAIPVSFPQGYSGEASVQRVTLNSELSNVISSSSKIGVIDGRLTLPPMPASLIVVGFDLGPSRPILGYLDRTESFADHYMAILDDRTPAVAWKISAPAPDPSKRYFLNISTAGPCDAAAVAFSWNGVALPVTGPYLSEVEIGAETVKSRNILAVSLKNRQQKAPFILGAASLVQEAKSSIAP